MRVSKGGGRKGSKGRDEGKERTTKRGERGETRKGDGGQNERWKLKKKLTYRERRKCCLSG